MTGWILAALAACAQAQNATPPKPPNGGPEELEFVRTRTAFALEPEEIEVDQLVTFLHFNDIDVVEVLTDINYGINEWLVAEMELPILSLDPDDGDEETGLGDVRLELKGTLPYDGIPFTLAVGALLDLPTGDDDDGLGRGEVGAGLYGAASHAFGEVNAHAELGFEVAQDFRPEYFFNVAGEIRPFDPKVAFVLAINTRFEGTEERRHTLIPGASVMLDEPELQIGAGFPIGVTDDAEEWGILLDGQLKF